MGTNVKIGSACICRIRRLFAMQWYFLTFCRWSMSIVVVFVWNICMSRVLALRVVLGMDSLRVGFELNSSSLDLRYNEGASHVVTYNNLIAIGVQGESTACAGDQGSRCYGIIERSARSHVHRYRYWSLNCVTKSQHHYRTVNTYSCAYDDNKWYQSGWRV
jgi:hypothetical protein